MEIRKTKPGELKAIIKIYEDARLFMRENGNPDQWENGYPAPELLKNDIKGGKSYLCFDADKIVGTFFFDQGTEPTYAVIYDGKWLNNSPYGVIHRIAVAEHNKGVATFCMEWCLNKCRNLRIDTHRDNIPMQQLLNKNGFSYCGIIRLQNQDERRAFQKSID